MRRPGRLERTRFYIALTSLVGTAPAKRYQNQSRLVPLKPAAGNALSSSVGSITIWNHGLRPEFRWPIWTKPGNSLPSGSLSLGGDCMWICTMLVCKAEPCLPFGVCCNFSGGTLGSCLMLIWCLTAWTSPVLTGQNTGPCRCLCSGIVPLRNISTSHFLIGLSGVGKNHQY